MKIMTQHSSASLREETPHEIEPTRNIFISNALRRRALAVINDRSLDPQWRTLIRYALEANDPWLAELVKRTDSGEMSIETIDFSQTPQTYGDEHSETRICTDD